MYTVTVERPAGTDKKRCTRCDDHLPLSEFVKDATRSDGLKSWCRACCRASRQRWWRENAEGHRAKKAEGARQWRTSHPDYEFERGLWRHYGMTVDEYEQLLDRQGVVCAICQRPEQMTREGKPKRLSVDHCHESGVVRGLLCNACNRTLGLVEDSPDRLRAAADYLEAGR